jgi:hypothetical protein
VDDVLVVSERGKEILADEIGQYFPFKPGPPNQYLGGHMRQIVLENGAKVLENKERQVCFLPRAGTLVLTRGFGER